MSDLRVDAALGIVGNGPLSLSLGPRPKARACRGGSVRYGASLESSWRKTPREFKHRKRDTRSGGKSPPRRSLRAEAPTHSMTIETRRVMPAMLQLDAIPRPAHRRPGPAGGLPLPATGVPPLPMGGYLPARWGDALAGRVGRTRGHGARPHPREPGYLRPGRPGGPDGDRPRRTRRSGVPRLFPGDARRDRRADPCPTMLGEIDIDGNEVNAYDASDQRFLEGVAAKLGPVLAATPSEPASSA